MFSYESHQCGGYINGPLLSVCVLIDFFQKYSARLALKFFTSSHCTSCSLPKLRCDSDLLRGLPAEKVSRITVPSLLSRKVGIYPISLIASNVGLFLRAEYGPNNGDRQTWRRLFEVSERRNLCIPAWVVRNSDTGQWRRRQI